MAEAEAAVGSGRCIGINGVRLSSRFMNVRLAAGSVFSATLLLVVAVGLVASPSAFSFARRARSALLGRPRFFFGTPSGTAVVAVGSVEPSGAFNALPFPSN